MSSPHRDRRGIAVFLALAFGLAWLPFLAQIAGLIATGAILMPVAPAIACFVVRKWVTREGFADAGLGLHLRHWPLYLLAVLWPVVAILVNVPLALAFHLAPGGFAMPWGMTAPDPRSVLTWMLVSVLLAPIIFGEEFGWRGYLQLRLLADRPWLAALVTGVIWGIWHYPLILAGGEETGNRGLTLLVFPLVTTGMSVFLGWLRLRAGTLWAGCVAHASNNVTNDSLQRLAYTGKAGGVLPASSMLPSLLSELLVWGGIVGWGYAAQRRHGRAPQRLAPAAGSPTPLKMPVEPDARVERHPDN